MSKEPEQPQAGKVLTLQVVKDLLKPLDERITEVLNSQAEVKATIREAATLKSENEKLKRRVTKMEEINENLCRRLSAIENRLLESNIILTGIREGAWETEEARKESVYEVISETVLGRTFDDRLQTAKTMQIRSTRCLEKYRQMYNRPALVEFMVKEDADYLLNNRSYLPNGVYINREYSKETEETDEQRSQTVYLTGSITPQNEQPQPGNSTNYMPEVESTTYHGVYAVP